MDVRGDLLRVADRPRRDVIQLIPHEGLTSLQPNIADRLSRVPSVFQSRAGSIEAALLDLGLGKLGQEFNAVRIEIGQGPCRAP